MFATLAAGVLASGFLLRTYIVMHDCSHGSFMPTKRQNNWVGAITGVIRSMGSDTAIVFRFPIGFTNPSRDQLLQPLLMFA